MGQKEEYRVAPKSKLRCGFHRHNQRRDRPSFLLLHPTGTLGLTPIFDSIYSNDAGKFE
jgi:hypothetical protein